MCMGVGELEEMSGLLDLGPNPRILISRTDRIGDVVLSLPVTVELAKAYPGARVDFIIRKEIIPLVSGQSGVAEVIEYDPSHDERETVPRVKKRKYQAVICLFPRSSLARIFARAGIPVRVGTARRWYSFRFTHRVNIGRRGSGRHEKDLNLDLLRPLGIQPDYSLVPKLVLTAQLQRETPSAVKALLDCEPGRPLVVIHPGDSGSAQNWSIDRYGQLAECLVQDGVNVVVTGLIGERGRHMEIFSSAVKTEQLLTGQTDLSELMAVLAKADLFVGGSTGPLHIAAAFGVPVVGLYGPIRTTTPDRWGPCGTRHTVFVPDVPVCTCKVGSCRLGNCMDRIAVEDVQACCRTALAARDVTGENRRPNKTAQISDLTARET